MNRILVAAVASTAAIRQSKSAIGAATSPIASPSGGATSMASGTVKWFNTQKGYGFIAPQDGSKDIFVHISAVERAGLQTLNEGQRVQFDSTPGKDGKTSAENLKVIG